MNAVNTGDTAWLLVSAALVLLMTPGARALLRRHGPEEERALHDHALAERDPARDASCGCSSAIRSRSAPAITGSSARSRSSGCAGSRPRRTGTVPSLAFVAFQMMFAIITPALISGAFAERMKFSAYVVVRPRVVHVRLRPGRALGVGRGGLALQAGRARLRGRHGRAPHGRRVGARLRAGARQAPRVSAGAAAPAQPHDDADRRGPPLVRLVRLQRRQRARRAAGSRRSRS